MWESLVSILTTTGTGGILGVLGSWLTKREERKNLEIKYKHEKELAEIRNKEAEIEAKHELAMADKDYERAELEGEQQISEKELDVLKVSLKEQGMLYGIGFVDAVRGMMRPLITIYLLIIATFVTLHINEVVGGLKVFDGDPQELIDTYKEVINQVLFLTATAVTWWFGSRPSSARKK